MVDLPGARASPTRHGASPTTARPCCERQGRGGRTAPLFDSFFVAECAWMSYRGTPSITSQLAAVWRMIRGGKRRMPAASTAGYQTRSLKSRHLPGRPPGGEHQRVARAADHQRRHALQDVRRDRHDAMRFLRLRDRRAGSLSGAGSGRHTAGDTTAPCDARRRLYAP
jgi:hypothetical protein